MISQSVFFFHFSKILIFWVVSGVKRAKNGPKWEKILSVMLHISGTIHHVNVSFVVHKCKMMISPCVFFQFLKILIFWVLRRVKGQKIVQNDKRFSLPTPYLKNHGSHDCHLWYTSLKRWYLHAFFSFYQNFDFLGC